MILGDVHIRNLISNMHIIILLRCLLMRYFNLILEVLTVNLTYSYTL